jgi:hypothetical protein
MDPNDETTNAPGDVPLVLPKHIRFARSLALVSGAVIGIAAGAALFTAGCAQNCSGFCGAYGVQPPIDAQHDGAVDHAGGPDGAADVDAGGVPLDGQVVGGPGGPGPAPRLPVDWLA